MLVEQSDGITIIIIIIIIIIIPYFSIDNARVIYTKKV